MIVVKQADYFAQLIALKRTETILDLESRGYETSVEEQLGDVSADLVARKGQQTVVYEFRLAGRGLRDRPEELRRLRAIAAESGFEFRLVAVAVPHPPTIEIADLESILRNLVGNSYQRTDLVDLASAVYVEDVVDVEILDIQVRKGEVDVQGNAVVEVRLEYGGGEARDGLTSDDAYPFSFSITLDSELKVIATKQLSIDTSSFYI